MIGVSTFVHPLGVVEDGEKLHDLDVGTGLLGKPKPVFENPGPMGNAVITIPRKDILFEDGMEDQGNVQCGHVSHLPGGEEQIDSPSCISESPKDENSLQGQPEQMDEPREREQLLVLVDVDVCREHGDQQGDDAPGSEPGIPWHKQQDAE